ncbi:unnamed protein product, partial [Acanthoscelides obtectus]
TEYSVFVTGECTFKKSWQGRWFQSGVPNYLLINSTFIETKGECYEEQGDKYLVYDKSEDCYRCMVIHPKHPSVLQYKETYCEAKSSLADICQLITGDAPLYSLFRKFPEAKPVACPFKSAPFTFSYNRMTGDCSNPPSKAESCTDDSRLVLKYQACPDVPATESNVEELICLATWKEGSTRYLIGKIQQGNRRSTSDEDQYRCFIYQRSTENGKTIYNVAQSGDATCTGLDATAFEGSRTMKLVTVDDQHKRCKFPVWITDHHTWLSLDHHKTYRFSQRNATLKILDDEPPKQGGKVQQQPQQQSYIQQPFAFEEFGFESQDQRRQNSEMRVVCHGILQQQDNKKCRLLHMSQQDATTLHPKKCPHLGKYSAVNPSNNSEKRKRRQQPEDIKSTNKAEPECLSQDYEGLSVGCNGKHEMEFKSTCSQNSANAYTCHGSWEENGVSYVIATPVSRKSTDSSKYCFIYTLANQVNPAVIEGSMGKSSGPPILRLSRVSESCHRTTIPGVTGNWAFNFTSNGTCAENDSTSSSRLLIPTVLLVLLSVGTVLVLR